MTTVMAARDSRIATARIGSRRAAGRGLALLFGAVAVVSVSAAPMASARPQGSTMAKTSKVVVKVVTVTGFGTILETKKGLPLYVDGTPPCTGTCLVIWPPLLMPAKKTIPLGVAGLGTTPFAGGLQVTLNGQPLYTFYADAKHKPPTGNLLQGFLVAPG